MDNREWISELNPDDAVVIFVVKADEKEDIVPGVVEDLDDDGIVVSGIKFNYEGFVGDEECTYKLVKFDDLNYKGKKIYHYHKMEADFTKEKLPGKYDLIYFDAFGPDKQPEMWTRKMFSGISDVTNKKGILVTYSAKGEVKRSLKACGFEVTLLPGPPGKRQMIRAVKI